MTQAIDPIAQRCADIVATVERTLSHNGQIGPAYSASDFVGGADRLTLVEMALRDMVQSVSDAVREFEDGIRRGRHPFDTMKGLLAFKVPDAMDLMQESFVAAMKASSGTDRWATFRDEALRRNLAIFIAPPPPV